MSGSLESGSPERERTVIALRRKSILRFQNPRYVPFASSTMPLARLASIAAWMLGLSPVPSARTT